MVSISAIITVIGMVVIQMTFVPYTQGELIKQFSSSILLLTAILVACFFSIGILLSLNAKYKFSKKNGKNLFFYHYSLLMLLGAILFTFMLISVPMITG